MKKSVSASKKKEPTKPISISGSGDLFLPNIFPQPKSTKSVSITSPTHLSKTSTFFQGQNPEIFLSPSHGINMSSYFLGRNRSLHNTGNFQEDLIKSLAFANNIQNLQTQLQAQTQDKFPKRHKYSKSQYVFEKQIDILKEAYKPRSQMAQAQLNEVLRRKPAQKKHFMKNQLNLETKKSNFVGGQSFHQGGVERKAEEGVGSLERLERQEENDPKEELLNDEGTKPLFLKNEVEATKEEDKDEDSKENERISEGRLKTLKELEEKTGFSRGSPKASEDKAIIQRILPQKNEEEIMGESNSNAKDAENKNKTTTSRNIGARKLESQPSIDSQLKLEESPKRQPLDSLKLKKVRESIKGTERKTSLEKPQKRNSLPQAEGLKTKQIKDSPKVKETRESPKNTSNRGSFKKKENPKIKEIHIKKEDKTNTQETRENNSKERDNHQNNNNQEQNERNNNNQNQNENTLQKPESNNLRIPILPSGALMTPRVFLHVPPTLTPNTPAPQILRFPSGMGPNTLEEKKANKQEETNTLKQEESKNSEEKKPENLPDAKVEKDDKEGKTNEINSNQIDHKQEDLSPNAEKGNELKQEDLSPNVEKGNEDPKTETPRNLKKKSTFEDLDKIDNPKNEEKSRALIQSFNALSNIEPQQKGIDESLLQTPKNHFYTSHEPHIHVNTPIFQKDSTFKRQDFEMEDSNKAQRNPMFPLENLDTLNRPDPDFYDPGSPISPRETSIMGQHIRKSTDMTSELEQSLKGPFTLGEHEHNSNELNLIPNETKPEQNPNEKLEKKPIMNAIRKIDSQYHIEITPNTQNSLNTMNGENLAQNSDNLSRLPSKMSVAIGRAMHQLGPEIPSIMINNEVVPLKSENNSLSDSMMIDHHDQNQENKAQSTTPKSLQNIIGVPEAKTNPPSSYSNFHLEEQPKKLQLTKNNHRQSQTPFTKHSPPKQIKSITSKPKPTATGNPIKKTKFGKKGTISLNNSLQLKKSPSDDKSKNSPNFLNSVANPPIPQNQPDDSVLHSKNSETRLLFPEEMTLNFNQKNEIYTKHSALSRRKSQLTLRKKTSENNKIKRMKLSFFTFVEKVSRFFDKNWKNDMGMTSHHGAHHSIEKNMFPLFKASKFSTSSPKNELTPRNLTPRNAVTPKNYEVANRMSHNPNNASNSLSPEWRKEKNSRIFSQSSRNLLNLRLSYSNTGRHNSHSAHQNVNNTVDVSDQDSEATTDEMNRDYEDIINGIDQKMRQHDEILANNYIHYNQKNIRTIINEEFLIFLENMVASNYFLYYSYQCLGDFLVRKILDWKFNTRIAIRKKTSTDCQTYFERSPVLKHSPKAKQALNFDNAIFSLKEEETALNDYLNHAEFKNLKMVIDEEAEESNIEDSSFIEKLPSSSEMAKEFSRKRSSLSIGDGFYRPKYKTKFLSASSPTNYEISEPWVEDDEYIYENNESMNKKIKDKMFLDFFMDIQKKAGYFLPHVKQTILGLITKMDHKVRDEKILKEEHKIDPSAIAKLEVENELVYKKERLLHELGQTYLKNNKSNFLTFCEENRNLLFGYFEDFYYENMQFGDYIEGDKRRKVNMLVQGLPIGIMGKQTSVRSLTTSTPDDDICAQSNLDGMKGAFLASRKRMIIRNTNNINTTNIESLLDSNTNKSKNEYGSMLIDLNFDTEQKDTSIVKNPSKKDESTNSTQTQTFQDSKIIKDDLFFNKNSESSFKLIQARRKTNVTVNNNDPKSFNFKGNSPNDRKLITQASFNNKKLETKLFIREGSSKKVLPQIPENELKLPTSKSFKIKKGDKLDERNHSASPPASPDKKSLQPKIFIEIPKSGNKLNEKEVGSFSGKLKNANIVNIVNPTNLPTDVVNEDNFSERETHQATSFTFANKQSMLEKAKSATMTKNSMILTNYLLHFNRKKNMNVLEQFFYAIKDEKMNELEELFFIYPNIFIDGRDDENNTMLINAARVGNLGMVNLILSKAPNINLRNNEGNTALHYSLAYGYDDVTNKLLRSGAQENIKNNEGRRPWDMLMRE